MTPSVRGRADGWITALGFAEGAESSMIGDGCAEVVLLLLNRGNLDGAVSPHRRCSSDG